MRFLHIEVSFTVKAHAVVRLRFSSEKILKSLVDALSPEINHPFFSRGKAILESEGTLVTLKVEAESTTALRSALNAYLRWISSMMNVIGILEN
jgi:tRNA threonylcarbamoyladenosine modification (KEOPS) complex  Pcc1 subunit